MDVGLSFSYHHRKPEVMMGDESIDNVKEGRGKISLTASGNRMELSGTISIRNKSGLKTTMPWKKEVIVMSPSGSIEMPQLNVLYRGYDNIVNATASGYPETILNATGATTARSGENYIVKPTGSGRKAYLSVSGKSADGRMIQLKRIEYRVMNLPKPSMYMGAVKEDGRVNALDPKLFLRYDETIPLTAKFNMVNWEISVPGAPQPAKGSGNRLNARAVGLINAARSGDNIYISVQYRDPSNVLKKKTAKFTKQ